jgi:Rrf2 family protein
MNLSQKCQYAFRAVFELAKRYPAGEPASVAEIAEVQAIPARFLEQILAELKQGGYVVARRGAQGGYTLAAAPSKLTVGDIIRFVEGPIAPVQCIVEGAESGCALQECCVFKEFWERAKAAVEKVYDSTTFEDLVEEVAARVSTRGVNYSI